MADGSLHLALSGRVELTGAPADAATAVLSRPKHIALLAYLAVEDAMFRRDSPARVEHFVRRERLAALLWPESDQLRARASLRRVIHQLRGMLGAGWILARGDEEIALDADFVTSDIGDFVRAVSENRLAAALELWRGDLMAGFHLNGCDQYMSWLDGRSADLRSEAAAAAWALARRLEDGREHTDAAHWARRAYQFRWDDERVLRRTLSMLDRLGDRAGALRLYNEFAKRLRSEFGAEPSPETIVLVERVRG